MRISHNGLTLSHGFEIFPGQIRSACNRWHMPLDLHGEADSVEDAWLVWVFRRVPKVSTRDFLVPSLINGILSCLWQMRAEEF